MNIFLLSQVIINRYHTDPLPSHEKALRVFQGLVDLLEHMTKFILAIIQHASSQRALSTAVYIGIGVEQWTKLLILLKYFHLSGV
jgi:hypothetical protein